MECKASWESGACGRLAVTAELCRAHYQQQHRGKPLGPLRGVHTDSTVPFLVRLPAQALARARELARMEGVRIGQVVRRAILQGLG